MLRIRRLRSTQASTSTFLRLLDLTSASSSLLSESKRGVETVGDGLFKLDDFLSSLIRAFGSLVRGCAGDACFCGLGALPLRVLLCPLERGGEGLEVD